MILYLDTSVILRVLLRQTPTLERWGKWDQAYSSELLGVEARRALDRLRLESALSDEDLARVHEDLRSIERAVGRIPMRRAVLARAAFPMPVVVRTLDAIHLASAMLLRERRSVEIVFATHDQRQATAARALGFDCLGL